MATRLGIPQRVTLFIIGPSLLVLLLVGGVIIASHYSHGLRRAQEAVLLESKHTSERAERILETYAQLAQAISSYIAGSFPVPPDTAAQRLFPALIHAYQGIHSLWLVSHAPQSADCPGLIFQLTSQGEEFNQGQPNATFSLYDGFVGISGLAIRPPHSITLQGQKHWLTSIALPLQGLAGDAMLGMEVNLSALRIHIQPNPSLKGLRHFVVAHDGTIAVHSQPDRVGQGLQHALGDAGGASQVLESLRNGIPLTITHTNRQGDSELFRVEPIAFAPAGPNWGLITMAPTASLRWEALGGVWLWVIVTLMGALAMVGVGITLAVRIAAPLKPIADSLSRLAKGELDTSLRLPPHADGMLGRISTSINAIIDGNAHKTSFAMELERGNQQGELTLLGDADALGKALLDMRIGLQLAGEADAQRRAEEKRLAWASEGHALLTKVLSDSSSDEQKLCNDIIKHIVKFLDMNQGGLFLVCEEDTPTPYLQLFSTFAWNRQKLIKKKLAMGEGLVGSCLLEGLTIELTEVPDDYVTIASGLGEANPTYVILVPLIAEGKAIGVIEMAGLHRLLEHEVKFVEQVSVSIASTIVATRTNTQTLRLLEQTRKQSEEMAVQEEEMRQNLEELLATQEELQKREALQIEEMERVKSEVDGKFESMEQEAEWYRHEIDDLKSEIEGLNEQLKLRESEIQTLRDKTPKEPIAPQKAQPITSNSESPNLDAPPRSGKSRRKDSKS